MSELITQPRHDGFDLAKIFRRDQEIYILSRPRKTGHMQSKTTNESELNILLAEFLQQFFENQFEIHFSPCFYFAIEVATLGLSGFTSKTRLPGMTIRSISSIGIAPSKT